MAKILFQLDVVGLPAPDSQSRGGVNPTPTYPALCARDPRLIKSAVPIHQLDWLPPSIHSDWCACLLCACSDWSEHSLSSLPLAHPAPIVHSDWLLLGAHSDWSMFTRLPLCFSWIGCFLRHLSQLAFDRISRSFLPCTEPLRESDFNPHNPLTAPHPAVLEGG